jgi:hypothetical protein
MLLQWFWIPLGALVVCGLDGVPLLVYYLLFRALSEGQPDRSSAELPKRSQLCREFGHWILNWHRTVKRVAHL